MNEKQCGFPRVSSNFEQKVQMKVRLQKYFLLLWSNYILFLLEGKDSYSKSLSKEKLDELIEAQTENESLLSKEKDFQELENNE